MKVSGLDVHKDSVFCSIYDGKQYGKTQELNTFTEGIRQMGYHLKLEKVKKVAMESTGIYWIPVWNILEDMGFELMLVNPYLIKQMPGRKSDIKDAQWIARLLHNGLLKGSLVPGSTKARPQPKEINIYEGSWFNVHGRHPGQKGRFTKVSLNHCACKSHNKRYSSP